jgi:hypothetical protein
VHKIKKQECLKNRLLEAEKLNVLYESIHLYWRIKEHRKELKLKLISC